MKRRAEGEIGDRKLVADDEFFAFELRIQHAGGAMKQLRALGKRRLHVFVPGRRDPNDACDTFLYIADSKQCVHEFRAFAGLTPSVYLRHRTSHLNHLRVPD